MTAARRRHILVLRYRFIGDTILTVPFLRNLRRAEPDAYIAWVVAPGSAEVIRGIPYVDELIYWDPPTIHADSRATHRTWGEKLAFVRQLRKKRFDKVYVLKRSLSSAIMAGLSGARQRIGFSTEGRGLLLTKGVPYRPEQHEVLNFLDVLRADGVPVVDDYLESWVTEKEASEAAELLAAQDGAGRPLLAMHPFGSIYEKTWPMERFAEVAAMLSGRYALLPVLLGANNDRPAFEASRHLFPEGSCDLVGRCGIRTSIAVLKRSTFFLGNDSGVMHLAASAGLPLVAVFGPTSPARFGPWGENAKVVYSGFPCSPCRQRYFTECDPAEGGRPACIASITVEQVFEACCALIDKKEHA